MSTYSSKCCLQSTIDLVLMPNFIRFIVTATSDINFLLIGFSRSSGSFHNIKWKIQLMVRFKTVSRRWFMSIECLLCQEKSIPSTKPFCLYCWFSKQRSCFYFAWKSWHIFCIYTSFWMYYILCNIAFSNSRKVVDWPWGSSLLYT